MAKAARKPTSAGAEVAVRPGRVARKQKLSVILITADDSLWPQIGADLSANLVLRQVDSVDELLSSTPKDQAAVVIWDARGQSELTKLLSRMNLHSARFAIIALDDAGNAGVWTLPLQHRQAVAHVAVPISGSILTKALESASEEVHARLALLGETPAPHAAGAVPPARRKLPLVPLALGAALLAGAVVYLVTRHTATDKAQAQPVSPAPSAAGGAPAPTDANEERLDALIERAQQAMTDRHFIEPAGASALSLYRDALLIDPNSGEARQGLQRLAEILIARVQSALDDRKFDVALQSLETARSIDASDRRLPALDEKIAALRAELGPAQISAAIAAQNFDRALQLIDEAARAKSLSVAKLAQLRDEVRKRREDFDQNRLLKLADTRLQQDKLLEPRNDSAAYYLDLARQAGAPAADVQTELQELQHRLIQETRAAIDQHRFADAERFLAEMHNIGVSAATVSTLQRDLAGARSTLNSPKPEQPQAVDLVQARIEQGKLSEPGNDSALFYISQLRSADPKNPALGPLSTQAQAQLLERARVALEGGDLGRCESLLQQAATLGNAPALDDLTERLRQKRASADQMPQVPEQSLTRLEKLEITYPYRPLQMGVEGWVELGYTVKADGSVSGITILGANPAATFDQAATKAVAKLRYQPVVRNGKPTPVGTQIRITFRIPKQGGS